MTRGGKGRQLTEYEAALLGVLGQGGFMEFRQLTAAMGETEKSWRTLYRRVRRLRGLPSDGGQTVSRVRLVERMRDTFRCPVCGKGDVFRVTRSFSYQWASAEFTYQHALPPGKVGERPECSGPRMTIAEGKRLKRAEEAFAMAPPEPELLETVGTRVAGSPKLVYGLSEEGAEALAAWCEDSDVSLSATGGGKAEGWRFLEHSLLTSEVYVRALVAMGCARRPWAFPACWSVEPAALKWTPLILGEDGRVQLGNFRYVKPDATMFVKPQEKPGLERGRRIFIEVERGTQNLTDPNMENAGAVESKVKRYESFCCYAPNIPNEPGPKRSYYRRSFPDDSAGPWLVVVSDEKRKKATLRALGGRESLSAAGLHGFRVRIVSFEEVGGLLAELAGGRAMQGEMPEHVRAPWRRGKGDAAAELPGVRLTIGEARALSHGALHMRQTHERLRERVRSLNETLPEGQRIRIEDTPESWISGARPLVERLFREVADADARTEAATPVGKARG
jgi:hypothetical protein